MKECCELWWWFVEHNCDDDFLLEFVVDGEDINAAAAAAGAAAASIACPNWIYLLEMPPFFWMAALPRIIQHKEKQVAAGCWWMFDGWHCRWYCTNIMQQRIVYYSIFRRDWFTEAEGVWLVCGVLLWYGSLVGIVIVYCTIPIQARQEELWTWISRQ